MTLLTGLPLVTVRIGGRTLERADLEALSAVRVAQALSVPAQCELTFEDPSAPVLEAVTPGAALEVRAANGPLFSGELTASETSWSGRRRGLLRVRGYDLLHRLKQRQPVRSHVNVSAGSLARTFAAELGLTVQLDADGPEWPWLLQWRQSDLELLADLAQRSGRYLVAHDGALRLVTLDGTGAPVPLAPGERILECELEVNTAPACPAVTAVGWDLARMEPRQARAEGRTGGRAAGAGERTLAGAAAWSEAHLEAAARAELLRRTAGEVVLRAVVEGDVQLVPGARVAVSGVTESLRGTYVVTSAEHVVDARAGFVTSVSTEPPERVTPEDPGGLLLGEVSALAPEGRVRVRLAGHGEVETDWLPVASPGAGADKGLALLPDLGDRVVVLLDGDPSRGIVLAGLWGPSGPPDPGLEGGRARRGSLRSAGGLRLELDDERRALRLEDAKGSFVLLSPEGLTVHAKVPLTLEAPGQPVVVRGASVDFRRA